MYKNWKFFLEEAEKISQIEKVVVTKGKYVSDKGKFYANLSISNDKTISNYDDWNNRCISRYGTTIPTYSRLGGSYERERAIELLKSEIANALQQHYFKTNKQPLSERWIYYKSLSDKSLDSIKSDIFELSTFFYLIDGTINESNWQQKAKESSKIGSITTLKEYYYFVKQNAKEAYLKYNFLLKSNVVREEKINSFVFDEENIPEIKAIEDKLDGKTAEPIKEEPKDEKLTFEPIDISIIESFIDNKLPKPARAGLYTSSQQSEINSIAYQFENIDRAKENTENEIVDKLIKRVYSWQKEMGKLLGSDIFAQSFFRYYKSRKYELPEYINKGDYYEWHPFHQWSTYALTAENGLLCKYGNCNFHKKDYWTYENVYKSLKETIISIDDSFVKYLNTISHKDIYDKSLTLKQWIDKYAKKLNGTMKSNLLTLLYDLKCDVRNVDEVIASYLKDYKEVKEEPKQVIESKPLEIGNVKDGGFIKIGYRPEFLKTPLLYGRERVLILANGEKHRSQYAIVDLENILASHNESTFANTPEYPVNSRGENINDRNYSQDKNAQLKVQQIAQNLEPEITISTSVTASGLPIITVDGVVVSGNNRTMSTKLSAEQYTEKYDEYKRVLRDEISAFGFDGHIGTSLILGDRIPLKGSSYNNPLSVTFKKPFLVRIDYDFPEYTTTEMNKYNKDTKKSERPIDKAIRLSSMILDNEKMLDSIISILDKFDNMSDLYVNRASTQALVKILVDGGVIITNELPEILSETGLFNTNGKDLLLNLLLSSVMDKQSLLASDVEGIKPLKEKIIVALPAIMTNAKFADGSIKKYINDAIMLESDMRAGGLTPIDFMRSTDMFGDKKVYDKKTYIVNDILKQGKFALKQMLESYNKALENNSGGSLFGDSMTTDEIFDSIITAKADETLKGYLEKYLNKVQKSEPEPVVQETPKVEIESTPIVEEEVVIEPIVDSKELLRKRAFEILEKRKRANEILAKAGLK